MTSHVSLSLYLSFSYAFVKLSMFVICLTWLKICCVNILDIGSMAKLGSQTQSSNWKRICRTRREIRCLNAKQHNTYMQPKQPFWPDIPNHLRQKPHNLYPNITPNICKRRFQDIFLLCEQFHIVCNSRYTQPFQLQTLINNRFGW